MWSMLAGKTYKGNLKFLQDLILYITGGAPWQMEDEVPEWINSNGVYVINNFSSRLQAILLAKELKKKVYRYPIVRDTDLSKEEERVFSAIFRNEKDFIISQQKKI